MDRKIQNMEIRQELEKLAKDMATSDMEAPVRRGRLQALWILYQLGKMPKDAPSSSKSDAFEMMRDAHEESMQIIRELRQQLLDKDGMICSLSERLSQNIFEILSADKPIEDMIPILSHARDFRTKRYSDQAGPGIWPMSGISWKDVHACILRAPEFIYIENTRLDEYDSLLREWVIIHKNGLISLSGKNVVTPLEFLDEETAAVYRFEKNPALSDQVPAQSARLVWERRFVYTAQMTREQQRKLESES